VAEAFVPSFGVLGIGGVVAFVLGGIILLDTDSPGFHLSVWVVLGTAMVSALFFGLIITFAVRAHRRPSVTGDVEVVGRPATVTAWQGGEGYVHVRGEEWRATSDAPLKPGDTVTVESMQGLTLTVKAGASDAQGEQS
jgi:membrane-bound serine protease (ClpP class)